MDPLRAAEKIELIVAEIYDLLAERFRDDEVAREMFTQLAREERQHARRLQMLRVRIIQQPNAFEGIRVADAELDALAAEGRRFKQELAARAELDLTVIKAELIELENRLATVHATALVEISHPEVRALFERLATHDHAHAELLGRS